MAALREALACGRLSEAVAAARDGAAPWELPVGAERTSTAAG
jgi:hypothetical protein